jgi:hypothetical protein
MSNTNSRQHRKTPRGQRLTSSETQHHNRNNPVTPNKLEPTRRFIPKHSHNTHNDEREPDNNAMHHLAKFEYRFVQFVEPVHDRQDQQDHAGANVELHDRRIEHVKYAFETLPWVCSGRRDSIEFSGCIGMGLEDEGLRVVEHVANQTPCSIVPFRRAEAICCCVVLDCGEIALPFVGCVPVHGREARIDGPHTVIKVGYQITSVVEAGTGIGVVVGLESPYPSQGLHDRVPDDERGVAFDAEEDGHVERVVEEGPDLLPDGAEAVAGELVEVSMRWVSGVVNGLSDDGFLQHIEQVL